jgi:hypothetical protein
VDLFTPISCKTVSNDRFKPSFITAEKKKIKNMHKKAREKVLLLNEKVLLLNEKVLLLNAFKCS